MSLTLGLTGMDPATEAALKAAFLEANARLGNRWTLVPDGEADHVVVDMDSMYGPMSWLRLHAAGRQVIGLTSAPRTQTDFRLGRPFDTEQLVALLGDVARGEGVELEADAGAAELPQQQAPARDTPPQVQAEIPWPFLPTSRPRAAPTTSSSSAAPSSAPPPPTG